MIKPSNASVKRFLGTIRELIRKSVGGTTSELIYKLNQKIRGWCNYFRHVVSKDIFSKVDHYIFKALQHWIKRRHPKKSVQWRNNKYFRHDGNRHWIFFAEVRTSDKTMQTLDLFHASQVKIKRHVKIRAQATPYDPTFKKYFAKRRAERLAKVQAAGLLGHLDRDGLRMARAV